MEQEKGTNLSPISAGCDAASCKAGDTPQGDEEAIYESSLQLMRNRVPEKQVTADTKVSEVVFPKKLSKRTPDVMDVSPSRPPIKPRVKSLSMAQYRPSHSQTRLRNQSLFQVQGFDNWDGCPNKSTELHSKARGEPEEKGNQISQVHTGSDKDVMSGTSETSSPSFQSALSEYIQLQSSLMLHHASSTDKKLKEPTQLAPDPFSLSIKTGPPPSPSRFPWSDRYCLRPLRRFLTTSEKDKNKIPGVFKTFQASSDNVFDQHAPDALKGTRPLTSAADTHLGDSQDNTMKTECPATADLSALQPSTREDNDSDTSSEYWDMIKGKRYNCSSNTSDWISPFIKRQDTDDEGIGSDIPSSTITLHSSSWSISLPVCDYPHLQAEHLALHNSTVSTKGITTQDASEVHPGGNSEGLMKMWFSLQQESDAGSPSVPSQSKTSAAKTHDCTRSKSLPDLLYNTFTPVISVDESDETYEFQCLCPGLYQCSVTGLVFHMEGDGDVVYRIVPWNRRLLAQHHQQPAGPLFDIKCPQQSVRQLYLPHCEVVPTCGSHFLSVAHVKDDSIEFIKPEQITETHVVINITGFSGFGNVTDENSPPDPVRALGLLFYKPPADPDLTSVLNVLLLPKNVVLRDVLRTRKKLVGDEDYIETSPHCKLCPRQEYTLSTCPDDDSVLVQPTKAEFDCDNYDNYFPLFQVDLDKVMKQIKLLLRDTISSLSVWERRVCLSSTRLKKSCGLNLPPNERLLDIRSSFISGISGPVLKSLLDKLFEKTVMTESERESADEMQNRRDKARFVIDTVRKKGEAASSEMIEFLCEADPFLSEYLGLT